MRSTVTCTKTPTADKMQTTWTDEGQNDATNNTNNHRSLPDKALSVQNRPLSLSPSSVSSVSLHDVTAPQRPPFPPLHSIRHLAGEYLNHEQRHQSLPACSRPLSSPVAGAPLHHRATALTSGGSGSAPLQRSIPSGPFRDRPGAAAAPPSDAGRV